MSHTNLTEARIANFTSDGKEQAFLWDSQTPHLGLRATARGSKAFVFQSKLAGQTIRTTIGNPKSWSIKKARKEARRLQTLIDQGVDPRQEKRDRHQALEAVRREASRQDLRVVDAWASYIEARRHKWGDKHLSDHQKMMHSGGVPYKHEKKDSRKRRLTKPGILVPLGKLRLHELTQTKVISWLKKGAAQRPTQTALAFRLLRGFVNWCAEEERYQGIIPPESIASKKVREHVPNQTPKDDALQKEQLTLWFSEVQKLNPIISAYLQVVLLTGGRREEIIAIRWENVNFKWSTINIADKVDGTRQLPLTPYVSYLISQLPRRNEWVFSSATSKDGRLVEPTIAHNQAQQAAGIDHVTIHGLRRSFGSLSEWVEMPVGVVYQIMGHKPSATAEKHYRRRSIDLLRVWHTKLEAWILEQAGVEIPIAPKNGLVLKILK